MHNTRLVKTVQLGFCQIADVACDFLVTQFGIAGNHGQLFDMDRRITIVRHHFFGNQNRILKVVAIPRHERDQHVLAQCQFAQVSRRTIGQYVATRNVITTLDDRTLVDVGVLVRTRVLDQVVDVHTHFTGLVLVVIDANHHTIGINMIDNTTPFCLHCRAGVNRYSTFNTRTNQRFFRAQAWHGLTLHVGAHQRPVGVIVFQEWNQRGRHGNDLRRRHVHVMHIFRRSQHGFTGFTAGDQIILEATFFVQHGVGLGDHIVAFLNG